MSCQRGLVRWRASMAAVNQSPIRILSKPDIAYRGVLGPPLQGLAPVAHCQHLRPADEIGNHIVSLLITLLIKNP